MEGRGEGRGEVFSAPHSKLTSTSARISADPKITYIVLTTTPYSAESEESHIIFYISNKMHRLIQSIGKYCKHAQSGNVSASQWHGARSTWDLCYYLRHLHVGNQPTNIDCLSHIKSSQEPPHARR